MIAYLITNGVNGKVYVGITCRSLSLRWKDHRSAARRGHRSRLYHSMRRHGIDRFLISPIASAKTYDDLVALERDLIAQYRSRDPNVGYNQTDGGEGTLGWVPSEVTRDRIREASRKTMAKPGVREHLSRCALAQWERSPEARERLSRMSSTRPRTPEERAKISASGKGRVKTESERANIAAGLRGKKRPLEVREKMSRAMRGRKASDETRSKMSVASKGRPKSDVHRRSMREAWVKRRVAERLARRDERQCEFMFVDEDDSDASSGS